MQTGLAVAAMSTAAIWNVARCAFVAQMGDTKMNSPGDKPSDSPTPRTEIVKRLRDLHLITCAADEKDSRHNKTLPSIAADCIEELDRELAEAIRVRENATNNHMETLEELDKAQADLARAIANHAADLTETQRSLKVAANLAYDPNLQSAQSASGTSDAERWRALLACKRIRVLGYARGRLQGDEGDIRRIGFEFTVDQEPYCALEIDEGRKLLTGLADVLRSVDSRSA